MTTQMMLHTATSSSSLINVDRLSRGFSARGRCCTSPRARRRRTRSRRAGSCDRRAHGTPTPGSRHRPRRPPRAVSRCERHQQWLGPPVGIHHDGEVVDPVRCHGTDVESHGPSQSVISRPVNSGGAGCDDTPGPARRLQVSRHHCRPGGGPSNGPGRGPSNGPGGAGTLLPRRWTGVRPGRRTGVRGGRVSAGGRAGVRHGRGLRGGRLTVVLPVGPAVVGRLAGVGCRACGGRPRLGGPGGDPAARRGASEVATTSHGRTTLRRPRTPITCHASAVIRTPRLLPDRTRLHRRAHQPRTGGADASLTRPGLPH